jgi:DnaJ-class molecular chaperone
MRDPYTVLGVSQNATDDAIKQAYRKLAKKLHPDLNPGKRAPEAQFKEVTAAYDFLSNPDKRARYDRGEIGPDGAEKPRFRPGGGFAGARSGRRGDGFAGFGGGGGIDDIISEFMGRGRQSATEPPAQKLKVPFLDAARGGKQRVTMPDGRALDVAIPAGTESGQRMRLKTPQGDAFLEIEVEPHPLFTRKECDIHIEVPVNLIEAVLGGSITVPTIHGAVALKVPSGSNTGTTLRLKAKGIAAKGVTGDQYVKLRVALPDPPDPELVKFLERWSADHGYEVRTKLDQN